MFNLLFDPDHDGPLTTASRVRMRFFMCSLPHGEKAFNKVGSSERARRDGVRMRSLQRMYQRPIVKQEPPNACLDAQEIENP